MMTIDEEIKKLEERLSQLKTIKNKGDDILKKTGNFTIAVFDEKSNEIIKTFNTFQELYDFWLTKMNETDYIYLEYYQYDKNGESGRYIEREVKTKFEFIEMVKEISTFNAPKLVSMTFTVCSKLGYFKYTAYIKNDYLDIFYKIDNEVYTDAIKHYFKSEEEYWNKIEEGKKYRLIFN
jgi:hypothetical protein